MGPFVPDIFSGEFNYVIALVIGLFFGYILENAGFSSSRKIAGLFYGYDFTVLKVFFTAGIVAMVGIIFLNFYGLLNIDVIFINPFYWPSAIVGGLIMGLGMVVGGYCPGTSICSSAIGKIDAMVFLFGITIGIFLFILTYPVDFYKSGFLGNPFVYDSIGMSRGLFVFLLVFAAIGTYVFGTKLEKKLNQFTEHPEKQYFKKYYVTIGVAVVIAFIIMFIPNWKTNVMEDSAEDAVENVRDIDFMTADELAFKLTHQFNNLEVIDVRSPEEFKKSNIPTAINIPLKDFTNEQWYDYIRNNTNILVFYSDDTKEANQAYFVAKEFGHDYNKVLNKGMAYFDKIIMHPEENMADTTASLQNKWNHRFRTKAKVALIELRKTAANKKKPKKKKVVRVVGGC